MTRRPTQIQAPQASQLTLEQMKLGIDRIQKRIEEIEIFDPASVLSQSDTSDLDALEAAIDETLVRTFGASTLDYDRYRYAASFDRGPYNMMYATPAHEFQASIAKSKRASIALLKQAVTALKERIDELGVVSQAVNSRAQPERSLTRKIFIVHGHNGEPREAVSGFLRKIDFLPIVLHEQTNQGRTIVEKFEDHADVDFAVVLLTPDDIGAAVGEEVKPRARQNVILELGYFIGKLGRKNVCAIKLGELEIPSDILGVIWTPFDSHGAWKTSLARELMGAGHEIDWNKVMNP